MPELECASYRSKLPPLILTTLPSGNRQRFPRPSTSATAPQTTHALPHRSAIGRGSRRCAAIGMPPKVAPPAASESGCHSGRHTIYLHLPMQVPTPAELPGQRQAPPPAFREATVREGKACSRSSASPHKYNREKHEVHPN